MARTIVFPSRNNVTYRAGYIKLTAFGSEFDQTAIEGNTASVVEALKETSRVVTPDFEGGGESYLDNAIQNMKVARSKMTGTVKFIAIMPIPLSIKDASSINWESTPSSFIDGAYGKIKEAGIGQSSTYAVGTQFFNSVGNKLGSGNWGDKAVDTLTKYGVTSGNNVGVEYIANGSYDLAASVASHPATLSYVKPGEGTKKILGMNSDKSLMMFHNEAASLNGTRQIVFDVGYWAEFKGIQPREFTLTWDIIPENHEDAINGLEMCARIREFSLPQSVSGVELLSPCYWWLDWSNKYLDAQTLYSNLVIKNVDVSYAEDGEWHAASTPKMFKISITFQEAKAPTSDLYKMGDNFIPVGVGASNGSRGSSGSSGSIGSSGSSGSSGSIGSSGSSGSSGSTGNTPTTGGIKVPQIPGFPEIKLPPPGGVDGSQNGGWGSGSPSGSSHGGIGDLKLPDIFRGGLEGIKTQIGDALGDKLAILGDQFGDKIGGQIGGKWGDKVNDAIDNITGSVADTIKDTIQTGNFKDFDDKLKQAIKNDLDGIKDEVIDTIKDTIEDEILEKIETQLPKDGPFKDILDGLKNGNLNKDELRKKIEEKIKETAEEKVRGVLGNKLPEIEAILDKVDVKILDPNIP